MVLQLKNSKDIKMGMGSVYVIVSKRTERAEETGILAVEEFEDVKQTHSFRFTGSFH